METLVFTCEDLVGPPMQLRGWACSNAGGGPCLALEWWAAA